MTPRERRNFWLCVGNGAGSEAGMAFFAYDTVMSGLAFRLTGSNVLVGLLTSTEAIGWLWPQIFVGSRIEHLERKMPTYDWSAVVRVLSHASMILSLYLCWQHPTLLYILLWLGCAIMSSAGGVCVIPFMDIIAKSIPSAHRSMLMGYRRLFGGLGASLAGLAVVYVLSPRSGLTYPYDYMTLLTAGLVVCAAAYWMFMRTDEPPGCAAPEPRPFMEFLRDGARIFMQDRDFRRFYVYRIGYHSGVMAHCLVVPFAMDTFHIPIAKTGWFVAAVALSAAFSSMIWGRIGQRWGESVLFRISTALMLCAPGTALAMALLAHSPGPAAWLAAHYLPLLLFIYVVHTIAVGGTGIAGTVYLLGLPPADRRPVYMAMMNTLSAPLTLTPVLAGGIAAVSSYSAAFAATFAASLFALAVSFRLRDQG